MSESAWTTGIPGLDKGLNGLLPGDNVVWQVDHPDDYISLAKPFIRAAIAKGKTTVYHHFSGNPIEGLSNDPNVILHSLDPDAGFENFTASIHTTIHQAGRGACHIFDCLSSLAERWMSDVMLGMFFKLTCPYLYDLETLAYFSLIRNHHNAQATVPIMETTQIFADVYRRDDLFIRPLKIQHRYASSMNTLHRLTNEALIPVDESGDIADILNVEQWSPLNEAPSSGVLERTLQEASDRIRDGQSPHSSPAGSSDLKKTLIAMMLTRDPRMALLAHQYLTLDDLIRIQRRMIGSGLIGGKSVGMLLARAILREKAPDLLPMLEAHDSFYVGSDVYYAYLVQNGIWQSRTSLASCDHDAFFEHATRARRLMLTGSFPPAIMQAFRDIVDYFGNAPFIVRSSSLLEDNYGHAFAGKYESVFCPNQGPLAQRMENFLAAVKRIYASTMSEKALRYRERRGMLNRDEQMGLLIMRVSGRCHGHRYCPTLAGVGFSFNPYAWSPEIDPAAGVLRLVVGLGTRAVERSDDDYTCLVALNAPERRPEHGYDQQRHYAQRKADFIDITGNHQASGNVDDLIEHMDSSVASLLTIRDAETERRNRDLKQQGRASLPSRLLSMIPLLKETTFVPTMRKMMSTLAKAYDNPVDIEFAATLTDNSSFRINLVQCRPLQAQCEETLETPAWQSDPKDIIIDSRSAIIGQSRILRIGTILYVVPSQYAELSTQDRYAIARVIEQLNSAFASREQEGAILLMGPGRWGTASPSLGVPVRFSGIRNMNVIAELAVMHEHLVPDVSLGTHFLSELVEMNMLYVALFPDHESSLFKETLWHDAPSVLTSLLPEAASWESVIKVIDVSDLAPAGKSLILEADTFQQRLRCFFVEMC